MRRSDRTVDTPAHRESDHTERVRVRLVGGLKRDRRTITEGRSVDMSVAYMYLMSTSPSL